MNQILCTASPSHQECSPLPVPNLSTTNRRMSPFHLHIIFEFMDGFGRDLVSEAYTTLRIDDLFELIFYR